MLLAFLPILLTGCAGSTEYVAPQLPAVTADLRACTDAAITPIPGAAGTALSTAQVAQAIGEQRSAALSKDRCAKAWDAFYADLRKSIGGASQGK